VFESAELGHKVEKAVYEKEVPKLRAALLAAQQELREGKKFAVTVLINGVDGAGKGETVNLLNEWMDPRHIETHAFGEPTDEERARPPFWRYWRALPPKGRIGILFGNWYTDPIVARAERQSSVAELDQALDEINRFEHMLVQEGGLLLKFWFHLSKEAQRKRLKAISKDPDTRWRVTPTDWERFKSYDRYKKVSEHVLRQTSTGPAPWIVVEGADERYRGLTAGQTLLNGITKRMEVDEKGFKPRVTAAPLPPRAADKRDLLNTLELKQELAKDKYEDQLEKWQGRLNMLARDPDFRKRSVIVVFEGVDAAGKGGAIRRVTAALDARWYRIVPVAAPTEEERAQPYLWRFWRHLPKHGRFTIFDRSWYGRVLVERVEGYCSDGDWMRAYAEINDFEDQVVRAGGLMVKFWLQISQEEQLKRFKEREATEHKRFKIGEEDWRNRKKWPIYQKAVCDMLERTSTEHAPWTLVEAENKYFARIKILKTLVNRLDAVV